jgi:hypothetical protein
MNNKTLIGVIIAVTILVIVSLPISIGTDKNGGKDVMNHSILSWHSYRLCTIHGYFKDNILPGMWIGIYPIVIGNTNDYYFNVTLYGLKGVRYPSKFIGFGFRGIIFPAISPRDKGSIDGYFRFCMYKE